jgi:hypothetical protein
LGVLIKLVVMVVMVVFWGLAVSAALDFLVERMLVMIKGSVGVDILLDVGMEELL